MTDAQHCRNCGDLLDQYAIFGRCPKCQRVRAEAEARAVEAGWTKTDDGWIPPADERTDAPEIENVSVVPAQSESKLVTLQVEGGLMDMDPDQFRAALDRRKANRKSLIEWVRSSLVEDIDYGSIVIRGRPSKPSLWKPGAEKICGMLNVVAVFPNLVEYEKRAVSGEEIDFVLLRCEGRYGGAEGPVVAVGAGARSVVAEGGDLNKAIKMAQKSGHIDMTLRMAGLSEIFAQDLEDMVNRLNGVAEEPASSEPPAQEQGRDRSTMFEYVDGSCVCGSLLIRRTAKKGPYITCELAHRAWAKDAEAIKELERTEATNPDCKGNHVWKWEKKK